MRPPAAALKELLDKPELQVMPGCGDAMGARLIEEAGFRIGFISGSSIAAMRLAMPDLDLLTFPEVADAGGHFTGRQALHAGQCRVAAPRHPARCLSAGDPRRHRTCDPRGARRAEGRGEAADGDPGGTRDRDPRRRLSRLG